MVNVHLVRTKYISVLLLLLLLLFYMSFILSLKYPQKLGTIEWPYGHVRQVVINKVQTYQWLKLLLRKFSEELWGSPI